MPSSAPYIAYHDDDPLSPVVLAVPHAGRAYPQGCATLSRAPLAELVRLEDRYADHLVARCIEAGYTTFIAQTPRLWIDLNRAETDYVGLGGTLSTKARNGLGLVPTRLSGMGPLWRQPPNADEVRARVETIHRPYHAALAAALAAAKRLFGVAVLIDIHSMPPLAGDDRADIVIGDRFGRACGAHIVQAARVTMMAAGLRVTMNAPYAGAYVLDRHGCPARACHAIQIELCRSRYLDEALNAPGAGLAEMQRHILHLAGALADAALGSQAARAAE